MTRFIRTGKLNIDALADYVQEAIARMLAKQAVAELANLGNFLINGFSVTPNANGNAFAQGGQVVTAFASGGIVSRPTYFRYGGGRSGLMGEAGPEAILPLKRGPGGRLGVQASGQAGPVVNIHLPMGVTRGELAAFVPTLKAQIKAELVGSMRRPGFAGS